MLVKFSVNGVMNERILSDQKLIIGFVEAVILVKQKDVFRELRRSDKLSGKLLVILSVKFLISRNVEKQKHTNISCDTFYRGLSFRGVVFTKFSQSRKW